MFHYAVLILVLASGQAAMACPLPFADALKNGGQKELTWAPPLSGAAADPTDKFGMRRHPILGNSMLHSGLDWDAPVGTPVRAVAGGRVLSAERRGELGLLVILDHGGGWETRYAHLQQFAPATLPGACIREGQDIAFSGSTGLSNRPHLHFEIRKDGVPIDPQHLQRRQ